MLLVRTNDETSNSTMSDLPHPPGAKPSLPFPCDDSRRVFSNHGPAPAGLTDSIAILGLLAAPQNEPCRT